MASGSVRPSSSFITVSRKQAIEKHSQVPTNLFNPLTDQMKSIVGHNEKVLHSAYFSNAYSVKSSKPVSHHQGKNSVFAKELKDLEEITVNEKTLLESLAARVRPETVDGQVFNKSQRAF